jgi:hypothetical protein
MWYTVVYQWMMYLLAMLFMCADDRSCAGTTQHLVMHFPIVPSFCVHYFSMCTNYVQRLLVVVAGGVSKASSSLISSSSGSCSLLVEAVARDPAAREGRLLVAGV